MTLLDAALAKANRAPLINKPEPIDNTDLVAAFRAIGGQILHIPPNGDARGVTFAFVVKGGRMQFSTAVQHRADCFTKKMGTKTAIEHFNAGKAVFIPLKTSRKPVVALKDWAWYFN